jgi:hypothetical protein
VKIIRDNYVRFRFIDYIRLRKKKPKKKEKERNREFKDRIQIIAFL